MDADFFGGTGDPPHAGHLDLIGQARNAERVLVICLTSQNPWKERQATDLEIRIHLMKLMLDWEKIPYTEDFPRPGMVFLSRFPYQYAVEVLENWRTRYPGSHLRWIVGPDVAPDVFKWKNWAEQGCEVLSLTSEITIRSTAIRAGEVPLHPAIAEFARANALYERAT